MVTLNDIAKACSVSRTTVSRVLSQDPDFSVSPQTRELILDTAASMNYNAGQRRRSPKSREEEPPKKRAILPVLKIGILDFELKSCESKANDYYNTIFAGIMAGLHELNLSYETEVRYILKDSYEELKGLDVLIILGKMHLDPHHPVVSAIKYKAAVDYIAPEHHFDSVRPDFYLVIQTAVDYFHSIGHHDIGYIGGCDYITQFTYGRRDRTWDFRHLAFRDYCLQNGIDPDSRIWVTETFSPEEGYRITNQLLNEKRLPSAVLYGSDELALGSYKAFQEHGIKIGEDVSIIGIDNLPFSQFLNPPLTTIALNPPLIGRTVAHALASQILQGRNYPLTLHPPIQLIERKSCKKAPPAV